MTLQYMIAFASERTPIKAVGDTLCLVLFSLVNSESTDPSISTAS
jgi:hypothetical protein